jgi:hypothetical protein
LVTTRNHRKTPRYFQNWVARLYLISPPKINSKKSSETFLRADVKDGSRPLPATNVQLFYQEAGNISKRPRA